MKRTTLAIEHTWDGLEAEADERCHVDLCLSDTALNVDIDAPFHNDPAPNAPAGSLDGLWEFEVVEVFLRGQGDRYLELEFGPFGHYLALSLSGYRQVERGGLGLEFTASRNATRWRGHARIGAEYLPPGLRSCNAYAIHGIGASRRYLAMSPTHGSEPDFHRLETFQPLAW